MDANKKYKAVTVEELTRTLLSCSPDRNKKGYVIGPDITGRLCHVASCFSMREAEKYADKLNAMKK